MHDVRGHSGIPNKTIACNANLQLGCVHDPASWGSQEVSAAVVSCQDDFWVDAA